MTPSPQDLKLGDHAALFFQSNSERLAFVIPYIALGLQNNERCIYIAEDNSVPGIYKRLQAAGVDLDHEQARGALSVVTKRETYLRHGPFEPDKMIADLNNEVRFSLEHGFNGLRASGEMSWALDLPSAFARLIEYEEKLQAAWPAEFGGVCQYDVTRFSPELIQRMKRIHSVYVENGQVIRQQSQPDFISEKRHAMATLRAG